MSRIPPDRYTFPWGEAEPCPCGSGIRFRQCCKQLPGQLPYVKLPSLLPPGPKTNYQHPKCYMAPTKNCSSGKSREHYVSEAILARFSQLRVSGMPWQVSGEAQIYPASALAVNILCERHNSALAPIDTLGVKAFDALTSAADYAVTQQNPGRARHYLASGEGLELWMFKLLAGIHFGGIAAAQGKLLRDDHSFPINEAIEALSLGKLPSNAGMYVSQNTGLVQRNQIGVGPLIDVTKAENIGVQVQFGPLRFETTIVPPPISMLHRSHLAARRRPSVVDFVGPARDARIILTWKGATNKVNRVGVEVQP
jgi:hypothetical protein